MKVKLRVELDGLENVEMAIKRHIDLVSELRANLSLINLCIEDLTIKINEKGDTVMSPSSGQA